MRILVLGAGVIGSVYAGKLLAGGHEVVLLARGQRLADLQGDGLILADAESGPRTMVPVTAVDAPMRMTGMTWCLSRSVPSSSLPHCRS